MSPEMLGVVLLATLIVGIFLGFPIAFTLIILTVVFGYIGFGARVFDLMMFQAIGLMKEEVLAAVPLFVFMGHLLEYAGLMERLFRGFQYVLAPVRGSLYLGILFTATLFATATGIIGASVTVMGLMAGPALIRSGYNPVMSAGVITAGGTLGILIPPSVMLVLLGPTVGVSIVKLFAAAIIPGLVLSGLYIVYSMVRSFLNPSLGPPLPPEERPKSWKPVVQELSFGMIPLAVLIFAALGSILAGLATPTEGAAMAAFGGLVLTIVYRRFNLQMLYKAVMRTLQTTSLILFLAMAANMYGATFSRLGTPTLITNTLLDLPLPPMGILILLMVVIFLLGWPLEWPAIVLIFVPIFLPVVQQLGFDLLWFSTLVAVNLQTAFLSPPVAMAAYYLKGVVPQWSLTSIYRGMLEFMGLQVIGLILVLLFPALALWLPSVLFD
jgi:tripartite ATP-independent transporter DctM subunit